jgi:hypothetical protein
LVLPWDFWGPNLRALISSDEKYYVLYVSFNTVEKKLINNKKTEQAKAAFFDL